MPRLLKRLNFSLQTMLAVVLLIGSGMWLKAHWAPWIVQRVLPLECTPSYARFSDDGQKFVAILPVEDTQSSQIAVFKTDACNQLCVLKREDVPLSARFSHAGQFLALAIEVKTENTDSVGTFATDGRGKDELALIDLASLKTRRLASKHLKIRNSDAIYFSTDDSRVMCGRIIFDTGTGAEYRVYGGDFINSACFPSPAEVKAEQEHERMRREKLLEMRSLQDFATATELDFEYAPAISPAGDRIATIASVPAPDGCLMCGLWDSQTEARLAKLKIPNPARYVATVFTETSAVVVVDCSSDVPGEYIYECYDLTSGQRLSHQTLQLNNPSIDLNSRCSSFVLSDGNKDWVFRPSTNTLLPLCGPSEQISDTLLAPNGNVFAGSRYEADNWDLQIREPGNDTPLAALDFPGTERPLCFSPDGAHLLAAYDNGHGKGVLLWQRRRPEKLYGILWLPEFWTTFLMLVVFIWTLRPSRARGRPVAIQTSAGIKPA